MQINHWHVLSLLLQLHGASIRTGSASKSSLRGTLHGRNPADNVNGPLYLSYARTSYQRISASYSCSLCGPLFCAYSQVFTTAPWRFPLKDTAGFSHRVIRLPPLPTNSQQQTEQKLCHLTATANPSRVYTSSRAILTPDHSKILRQQN